MFRPKVGFYKNGKWVLNLSDIISRMSRILSKLDKPDGIMYFHILDIFLGLVNEESVTTYCSQPNYV